MYTREQLETALRNADAAGDTEAATRIAAELVKVDPSVQKAGPEAMDSGGWASNLLKYGPGFLKEAGQNVATGFTNMLDSPANITKNMTPTQQAMMRMANPVFGLPAYGTAIQEVAANAGVPLKQEFEPVTGSPEGFMRSVMQFTGGSAFGPGGVVFKAGQGAFGGAGGELAAKGLGEKGRILGELVGLLGLGAHASRMPNSVRPVQDVLKSVSQKDVSDAVQAAQLASKTLKTPVSVTQGFKRAGTMVEALGEILAQGNPKVQRILGEQVESGKKLADEFVEGASPLNLNQKTANRVRDAGVNFVDKMRGFRQGKTQEKYDKLHTIQVDSPTIADVVRDVVAAQEKKGIARESSEGAEYGRVIKQYSQLAERAAKNEADDVAAAKNRLSIAEGKLSAERSSKNDAVQQGGQLDARANEYEQLGQKFHPVPFLPRVPARYSDLPERKIEALDAAQDFKNLALSKNQKLESLQNIVDLLTGKLKNTQENPNSRISAHEAYNPGGAAGREAFAAKSPNTLTLAADRASSAAKIDAANSAKQSLENKIPEIAEANQAHARFSKPVDDFKNSQIAKYFPKEEGPANLKAISKMLNESPDQISYARKILGVTDKDAFGAIAKQHWKDKLDAAYGSSKGQISGDAGGKFAKAVAGNDRDKFLTTVVENAKAQGKDPLEARKVAGELLDALEVSSRGRKVLPTDPAELQRQFAENPLSKVVRAPGVLFGGPSYLAASVDRVVANKVKDKLIDLFYDPDFVSKAQKILETTKGELRGKVLLNAVMGVSGTEGSGER